MHYCKNKINQDKNTGEGTIMAKNWLKEKLNKRRSFAESNSQFKLLNSIPAKSQRPAKYKTNCKQNKKKNLRTRLKIS